MRLFSEIEPAQDARTFAALVERRLARSWALRRWLIAAAGAGGAAIALMQALTSGLAGGLGGVARLARAGEAELGALAGPRLAVLDSLAFTPEAIWLILGLAILAGALLAGRALEDL